MIKSVSIQNFEAHEDTTVEFGEGMNSIVGLSNSGKSAIIRAMMVVVDNEWSKEMVRTGSEFCRVRVETERGWVEAERGEKVNRWRCREGDGEVQMFQKVGTSVPELATKILGMGRRDRGNGVAELPNFQTQLEKHYMLAEVGEKKATSNMIAVMMDNAIGLGGMEDLIKDFSADLLRDRRWLNEKQAEIVDLKTGIADESIFRECEKAVSRIGELQGMVETMDGDIGVADGHMSRYSEAKAKCDAMAERLDAMPDCSGMEGLVSDIGVLDGGIALAEKAVDCERRLAAARSVAGVDVEGMAGIAARCGLLDRTMENCARVLDCSERLAAAEAVMGIDDAALESVASEVSAMGERISQAEKALRDARELWRRQSNAEKESKALAKEQSDAESEFDRLKDELGVCPLCGAKL